MSSSLKAGVARLDITPPVPIDLVGYSRRWRPATEVRAPLTATCLVLDDGEQRVAVLCLDLPILRPLEAEQMRIGVAKRIDTVPEAILINVSHTHAGPHTHEGGVKIGGDQRGHSPNELSYISHLPHTVEAVAILAAQRLQPARLGAGVGSSDLAVNRRERTPEGRTILGWNPEGTWDRDVGVLRVDDDAGSPMALLVNFACHPVVVGPDDPAVNPDFPGALRDHVEHATGATCLFLQGAGGNVLPLEGFFDESGPEIAFGKRLGIESVHVADGIEPYATEIHKLDFGSVTPISRYRKVRSEEQSPQRLKVVTRTVDLPLKRVPSPEDVTTELQTYTEDLELARARGAGGEVLNPLEYHVNWAEEALRQLEAGWASTSVPAFLQAFRLGEIALVAIPGEVFSEIAIQIKERSPAEHTLFAGYANGIISYLPTADEYPYGGYECDYAHHSYGLVEQVAPESEQILVESALELLYGLW